MEDIAAQERNDKLRQGAINHPRVPEGITVYSPEEAEGMTISAAVLCIGILGLGGLAGVLGSIFIFAPFWMK
jgi:hypothetical protein